MDAPRLPASQQQLGNRGNTDTVRTCRTAPCKRSTAQRLVWPVPHGSPACSAVATHGSTHHGGTHHGSAHHRGAGHGGTQAWPHISIACRFSIATPHPSCSAIAAASCPPVATITTTHISRCTAHVAAAHATTAHARSTAIAPSCSTHASHAHAAIAAATHATAIAATTATVAATSIATTVSTSIPAAAAITATISATHVVSVTATHAPTIVASATTHAAAATTHTHAHAKASSAASPCRATTAAHLTFPRYCPLHFHTLAIDHVLHARHMHGCLLIGEGDKPKAPRASVWMRYYHCICYLPVLGEVLPQVWLSQVSRATHENLPCHHRLVVCRVGGLLAARHCCLHLHTSAIYDVLLAGQEGGCISWIREGRKAKSTPNHDHDI
mmetsp:Transcript_14485/g.39226  ORF Transcript_14485/g.39226 Transcript_14485/m.39226 type:complete len:385 (-) Transcript_14485:345-1499(-)